MVKATWQGTLLAESEATQLVEGNHYFPAAAVRWEHLRPSVSHSTCAWKGIASYYDVVVGEAANPDAAWSYPEPKAAARRIAGHIAFWKGITIEA